MLVHQIRVDVGAAEGIQDVLAENSYLARHVNKRFIHDLADCLEFPFWEHEQKRKSLLKKRSFMLRRSNRQMFHHGAGKGVSRLRHGSGLVRRFTQAEQDQPVEILQNTFSDRTRCIAQLRPGSSFLLRLLCGSMTGRAF